MKKKVKLKDEWVQRLLLHHGTRRSLAKDAGLSVVTTSKALNGEPIGAKARESLFNVAKVILVSGETIVMTDVFIVE